MCVLMYVFVCLYGCLFVVRAFLGGGGSRRRDLLAAKHDSVGAGISLALKTETLKYAGAC